MFCRFLFLTFLAAFAFLSAGAPARAMDMYAYDLDSLVYLSTDIIDAEPVSVPSDKGADITTVKVTQVYLGHFHAGDLVKVTALDFFRVERPDKTTVILGEGGRRLGIGDRLTLFLSQAHSVFLYDVPKNEDIYWPAPSGVKMLDEGHVKGFQQYSNPGPYEMEWTTPASLEQLPTPEQFQRQLGESIRTVEPLRPLLTKHAVPADEPALLQVLRQRARGVFPSLSRRRDAISDAACGQVVSLHDLNALADALAVTTNKILTSALQNPPSRDFLLRVIGSPAQPHDRRLGCAKAASAAFAWWDLPSNGDYLSRLISLCKMVEDTPDVAATLLGQLNDLARYDHSDAPPAQAYPIIKHGLPVLRQVYSASHDGAVRFAVEQLFLDTAGESAYQALHSPCGPTLSLTRPMPPAPGAPASPPTLGYLALIRSADSPKHNPDGTETTTGYAEADVVAALVLVNVKSKKRYTHLKGREVDGLLDDEGERLVMQADLPLNLPHGCYHVFLKFIRPGQPVSVGYGYDVAL